MEDLSIQFMKTAIMVLTNSIEGRACPDIIVWDSSVTSPFKPSFLATDRNQKKTSISNLKKKKKKRIVIVLESPHVDEFSNKIIQPAKGKTGEMLNNYFDSLIWKPLTESDKSLAQNNVQIILMNSIQFQCSLGQRPSFYRDQVFLKLWFDGNFSEDFYQRLKEYDPDYIINLCTKDIITQKSLREIIQQQVSTGTSNYTLKEFVSQKIDEYINNANKKVICFEGNHPSSWYRENNRTQIKKREVIPLLAN